MRFALIQIGLGVALIALAILIGEWALFLLWPGWSVLIVGIAYLNGGPGVFGKRLDGRLRWLNLVVLWPYFLVAWTLWQLKSRGGESPHDEVAPGIIVGRRPLDEREMPSDATVVVDLTSEFARAPSSRRVDRYVCLPILDTRAPDDEAFRALIDDIEDADGPIFVHCAMGHGRSATVAAALMIRRGLAKDVETAIAQMTEARPGVYLHRNQREAVARLS